MLRFPAHSVKTRFFASGVVIMSGVVVSVLLLSDERPSLVSESSARPQKVRSVIERESRLSLKEALAQAGSSPNIRAQIYSDYIKRKFSDEKSKVVFEAILADFGPGKIRCELLKEFFLESNTSLSENLGLIRNLSGNELQSANLGLMCRIGLRNELVDFDEILRDSASLTESEVNTLVSGLSLRVDPAFSARIFGIQYNGAATSQNDRDRYFNQAFNDISKLLQGQPPEIMEVSYSCFFENAARSAPFEAWRKLQNVSSDHPEIMGSKSLMNSILANMAAQDPKLAMTLIAEKSDTSKEAIGANSRIAFSSWLKEDSNAALDWFSMQDSSLNARQKDGCNEAMTAYYLQSNDVDKAREIVKSISDAGVKQKVEGQIWSSQRKSLLAEVERDPAGTIQSIVAGQSRYETYWLEEAVGGWVQRNFDGANNWYQNNWKTLPADRAQYVAAAFATQAAKQGDTATARQWAAHIQNPKTKQRVEAGIAKAEHADGQQ
jgi:hypothetical protein